MTVTPPRRGQWPPVRRWVWRWRWQLAVVATLGLLRVLWQPSATGCQTMTTATCLAVATLVVAVTVAAGSLVRASWLIARTRAAVKALTPAPVPEELTRAVARLGVRGVRCVAGTHRVAFCAGPIRPQIYLTLAMATAPADELGAVLAHEAAHARRRDPLRRALSRAIADVLCWVPLMSWWADRSIERSELHADRAAIACVGAAPLARALAAGGSSMPGLAPAFEGAAAARVAQLLGEEPPRSRPRLAVCLVSLLGVIALVSLGMCVGQALLPGLFG